jgi:UPF0042 nucleotide-binding protein
MQLVLISGLSGSGKSIVLKALEDSGYYCIDNLPANLLPQVGEYLSNAGFDRAAVAVDVRGREPLETLPAQITALRGHGLDVRLLFLETNTETLVKRFSETRRLHPLSVANHPLTESIQMERDLLAPVSQHAHRIDTSGMSPNQLRAWIKDFVELDASRLILLFQSFGFKNGLPLDADFVFDVRCLPNPHYDPILRPLTGRDPAVIEFIEQQHEALCMLADIRGFVEKWLPSFVRDNRSYLTVGIGCTGGRHRSVFMVERLARLFEKEYQVLVRHRELG